MLSTGVKSTRLHPMHLECTHCRNTWLHSVQLVQCIHMYERNQLDLLCKLPV